MVGLEFLQAIRRTAGREGSASRHHGGEFQDPHSVPDSGIMVPRGISGEVITPKSARDVKYTSLGTDSPPLSITKAVWSLLYAQRNCVQKWIVQPSPLISQ